MANKKFSELTPVTTLDGTEYTPVIQAATNKTATIGNILGDTTGAVGRIKFKAGGATALTAPIKLISATLNNTAEAGAIEFLTDAYYGTITSGNARKTFAFLESPTFTGTIGGITASMVGAQPQLNGTGFVVATGTTISYDNSVYLTAVTAHNVLSTTHGDTLADTVIRGDIIYGNATPKWARLAIGTVGKVIQSDGTDIGWSTNALGTAAYTASTAYEVPLTFGSGVTRTVNAVANDLITGKAGGQTILGSTLASENLILSSTSHATIGSVNVGTIAKGENLNIQATEGAELAPALTGNSGDVGGWTLSDTTGYVQPFNNSINKTGNGTGTITMQAATTIVAGTTYKVVIVVSAISGSTATYTLGGVSGTTLAAATTYTDYITVSTTGKIIITPVATALRITITSISIKALTDATGDLTVVGNLRVNSPIEGGNTPSSYISYKSTTGVGLTTGVAHQWLGGTNGATILATMLNNGNVAIGTNFKSGSTAKLVITDNIDISSPVAGTAAGINFYNTPASTVPSAYLKQYSYVLEFGTTTNFGDAYSSKIIMAGGTYTKTNTIGKILELTGTINNSGTAGYTGMDINITETALGSGANKLFDFRTNNVSKFTVNNLGGGYFANNVGIGITSPTSRLHLAAGTATAGTAPIKINPGTLLTVVENGAIEFDGDYFYASSGLMTGINHRRRVVTDDRVVSFNDESVFMDDNLVIL